MASNSPFPIIDSHIHLYARSHLPHLSWTGDLPPDHVLNRGNTVEVYKRAISSQFANVAGFVFLETDRKSALPDSQWTDPLAEAAFLSRIARGEPLQGEGHTAEDAKLVLGVVPWAPLPAGVEALERYVSKVLEMYQGEFRGRVKGFRYLLQDKPRGLMLQEEFIAGLVWLGERDLSFDLGVDARSGGMWQLEEVGEMLGRVYGDEKGKGKGKTRVVINHLCKPNLRVSGGGALQSNRDFVQWKKCVERMAAWPLTYMKLSGLFSELPEQEEERPESVEMLVNRIRPWAQVVFRAFTPRRIMFGSDWPVCNVDGPGAEKSWGHWHAVVTAVLEDLKLSEAEKARVWHGTAAEAYRISSYQ